MSVVQDSCLYNNIEHSGFGEHPHSFVSSAFCHYCGSANVNPSGCHLICQDCDCVSEGCGD